MWYHWHAPLADGLRLAIMTVAFAPGTPLEVREMIGRYLAVPDLSAELRAAIVRLASSESMELLWRQLPASLQGKEEGIIAWSAVAYVEATSLPPPYEVYRKERDEFLRAHAPFTDPTLYEKYKAINRKFSPLTYSSIAVHAHMLREYLGELTSIARQHWAKAWPGDRELTFDRLRSVIQDIESCCERLDAETRQFQATLNLPKPPRKLGGHTAPRVYFDRVLKAGFQTEFGRPYPDIVAILEQVVFDLPDTVDESTVRKR
jgi:hypothetical protein